MFRKNAIGIAILTLLFAGIACSFFGSSATLDELPNYGIFMQDGRNLAELSEFEGEPNSEKKEGIPITNASQPTFLVWLPSLRLEYFYLNSPEHGIQISLDVVPVKDDILEIKPEESLNPGKYCFIQGNPLGSPYSLPHWCFIIAATDSLGNLLPATSAPTGTPTPELALIQTSVAQAELDLAQAGNAATLSVAETVIGEATMIAATQDALSQSATQVAFEETQTGMIDNCDNVLANVESGIYSDFVPGANFDGCDLSNINLFGFNLNNASFRGANLLNTNFSKANLSNADFAGAYINNTNFSGAELGVVSFEESIIGFEESGFYFATSTISWNSDGSEIAITDGNSFIEIWKTSHGVIDRKIPIDGYFEILKWNPQLPYLAGGRNYNREVYIWNTESLNLEKTIQIEYERAAGPLAIAWHPEGNYLAVGLDFGPFEVWDVEKNELVASFGENDEWTSFISWSPDGRFLISVNPDKVVGYNVSAGEKIFEIHQRVDFSDYTRFVSWSPDSTMFATVHGDSSDTTLNIWGLDSNNRVTNVRSISESDIDLVAWSKDEKNLLIAGGTTVDMYSISDNSILNTITVIDVTDMVEFSPDRLKIALYRLEQSRVEIIIFPLSTLFP
jgi:hypothetical protein